MYYALSLEHPTEEKKARKTLLTRSVREIPQGIKNNDYTAGAATGTSGASFSSSTNFSIADFSSSLPHSQVFFLGHMRVCQAVNRSFLISTLPH